MEIKSLINKLIQSTEKQEELFSKIISGNLNAVGKKWYYQICIARDNLRLMKKALEKSLEEL